MADVINIIYLKDGIGGGQDSNGVVTHQENIQITFDEIIENTIDAIADSGLIGGQQHRLNSNLILQSNIEAFVHPDDLGYNWIFELTYSTAGFNESSLEDDTYTPKVSFGKWTYNRVVSVDKETDDVIKLPTGEPYDPQPVEQVSAVLLSITMKEYSANISRISMIGSINQSAIRICGVSCPKYCAMLDDYRPVPHRDNDGFLTFRNTFVFKLKFFKNRSGQEIGFKLESLAASFNELSDGDLTEITVKDNNDNDVPVATPQMIDETGSKTTSPYYQEWVIHDLANFSSFGLPSSYPVS